MHSGAAATAAAVSLFRVIRSRPVPSCSDTLDPFHHLFDRNSYDTHRFFGGSVSGNQNDVPFTHTQPFSENLANSLVRPSVFRGSTHPNLQPITEDSCNAFFPTPGYDLQMDANGVHIGPADTLRAFFGAIELDTRLVHSGSVRIG
jgi:hypothetical protein